MIARIEGTLTGITGDRALLDVGGGVTYELLLPAFTAARLGGSIDQHVTLYTLHFLESSNQGSTFFPRLAGFVSEQDKAFFELFVSCKGIGYRKALRAMALPAAQLAAAIEDRDLATLQSLPEVGKRTAETIAATLRGKVERFLGVPARSGQVEIGVGPVGGVAREALEALVTLGEKRTDALRWIDRVMSADQPPEDAQAVIAAVYRMKSS